MGQSTEPKNQPQSQSVPSVRFYRAAAVGFRQIGLFAENIKRDTEDLLAALNDLRIALQSNPPPESTASEEQTPLKTN